MITTLDRMVLVGYFRSYAIVWSEPHQPVRGDRPVHAPRRLREPAGGFIAIAGTSSATTRYRVPQVFDLLAEPITLMAATFTRGVDAAEQRTLAATVGRHPDAAGDPPDPARRGGRRSASPR